jgi:single-strand DNA-binding protein
MASFNNCTFSGNVGRDPDIRYFEDGRVVANFNLAVEGRKGRDTLWMKVAVWNKPAQVIADYVKKGSKIIVSGELQQETWTKEGVEKSQMVLSCEKFTLLDFKKDGGGAPSGGAPSGSTSRPAAKTRPAAPVEDEDVPF